MSTEQQVATGLSAVAAARTVDVEAALADVRHRIGAGPRRRRTPRFVLVATTSALLVVTVLATQLLTGGPGPQSAVAATLHEASRTAAAGRDIPARPHQFTHARFSGTAAVTVQGAGQDDVIAYLQETTTDLWLSVDGTRAGLSRTVHGRVTYLSPGDEGELRRPNRLPATPGAVEETTLPRTAMDSRRTLEDPGYANLRRITTDRDDLYDLVGQTARGGTRAELSQRMLDVIGQLLSYSTAPPALRASLYDVAARVPGIEVLPSTDSESRTVAVTAAGVRRELVFDSTTSELRRQRLVVLDPTAFPGVPAGTVVEDASRSVEIVDRVGQSAIR